MSAQCFSSVPNEIVRRSVVSDSFTPNRWHCTAIDKTNGRAIEQRAAFESLL